MTDSLDQRASYTSMATGTQADWDIIKSHSKVFSRGLADRVLDHLRLLGDDCGGFAVSRLEHSLQTATRAFQAGSDEETVVCALLHDIGDTLCTYNHGDLAAAVLKPFVSEKNHWIVEKHPIFQGYYFFHYLGGDRNAREQFRGHPWFEACAFFCHQFDQSAFDPAFKSMPLEAFEPMVRRVLAKPRADFKSAARTTVPAAAE